MAAQKLRLVSIDILSSLLLPPGFICFSRLQIALLAGRWNLTAGDDPHSNYGALNMAQRIENPGQRINFFVHLQFIHHGAVCAGCSHQSLTKTELNFGLFVLQRVSSEQF